ncbi:hypothetical protein PH7735_01649 [Shimia thalassica]|uniref:Uncharacterized protein n=1 Tax=Shimia thalassica TaxID=1715693 RepID=A0A0P1I6N1_9RHOB|nr:hypothetical protein PH7735_01649 [Shimia thalassica]
MMDKASSFILTENPEADIGATAANFCSVPLNRH